MRREVPRMPERTLDAMAAGGMYDLVGGGFHRYSVDQKWLVPHFEKMLYDNAQLAVTYLHGWQTIGKARYRQVVEQTLGYMLRELRLGSGGFASSQDADTDGKEGLTFTWTRSDGIPDTMLHAFEGGRFVLRGDLDEATRAELFAKREERPKPARDDKAVASWNGLALAALAECGRVLDRADWVEAARRLGEFLLGAMSTEDGGLHRTWRDGVAKGTGYLEDYADVANGLLELHAATGELRYLEEANRLARLAIELFHDPRERRLLPDAERRGGARRAAQGVRRLARAERELDARLRAPSAVEDLRRRRARGEGGRRVQAQPGRAPERRLVLRLGARRRRPATSRRGERSRSSGRRRARSPARRFAAGIRTP